MQGIILQKILDDIRLENLPANWSGFDLKIFSKDKTLWDYQQSAVEHSIAVLWRYYEYALDYTENEDANFANDERRSKLDELLRINGMSDNLDLDVKDCELRRLLSDYYPLKESGKLEFKHYLNRACFWMATGSGKTLVIVKILEILHGLIQRGELPPNDILFLSHRDDLINQFRKHVEEFNELRGDFHIKLRDLKEYASVKREMPSLFKDREMTVFYYWSNNLADEQKDKIIDFRNYENDGKWFILLDEAHKGGKEDSKRQHIYSIMSRNGFLFNFSATFTEKHDLTTTAFNFNLKEFINAGYGKHIAILEKELNAFRDKEDFSHEAKQKIVLQSFILLAYARGFAEKVRELGLSYHRPLLLTLVNSVNTDDADLKVFFDELESIATGKFSDKLWETAKNELWDELRKRPNFVFEEENCVDFEESVFKSLTMKDILRAVFNADAHGKIEVIKRPSDKNELAFKLKSGDLPFALSKIGDNSEWLKEKLSGPRTLLEIS